MRTGSMPGAPDLAAGMAELLDGMADELLTQLVDDLTFALEEDRISLPAEGAEAWVLASEFADRARASFLSALERVRVVQDDV